MESVMPEQQDYRLVVTSDWHLDAMTAGMNRFDDVSGGGQAGTDTWEQGDLVRITDPNLAFEPGTTDGTFSVPLDIELFAPGTDTNALHFVTNDIQVGASNAGRTTDATSINSHATTTYAPAAPYIFRRRNSRPKLINLSPISLNGAPLFSGVCTWEGKNCGHVHWQRLYHLGKQ